MDLRSELIRQADAYCEEHHISRARLGVLVMNDNKFFDRITGENAGGFTVKTFEKFQRFFAGEVVEAAE